MQRQLELWPTLHRLPQRLGIWEGLDRQQRTAVIAALARLISKVVYPGDLDVTQKNNHEG